jgi:putative transcriptional regulator
MSSRRDAWDPEEDAMPSFEPLQPSDALRARVLASAVPASRFEGFVARFARLFDVSEARAREVLAVAADTASSQGWVEAPLPGVRLYHFSGGPRFAAADCGLVRVDAGLPFPNHRHLGREWNFILTGGFDDSSGEVYLPGDLLIREIHTTHAFRAQEGEPLLMAVILEGGLEIVPPEPEG